MEETIALLKACIVSRKGGVPLEELDVEYTKIVGEPIPYLKLGYSSLYDFLSHIHDIRSIRNESDEVVLIVTDPKFAHIDTLISRQKDSLKNFNANTDNSNVNEFGYKLSCSTKNKEMQYKQTKFFNNVSNRKMEHKNARRIWCNEKRNYSRLKELDRWRNSMSMNRGGICIQKNMLWSDEDYCHSSISTDTSRKMESRVVCEPIVNGQQLIGDDFFLQLAIRNLGAPVWRKHEYAALQCGLCISGQTISECVQRLQEVECLSNRIVLLLGAVDIYKGNSCEQMVRDMQKLLNMCEKKFAFSRSAITICTIPPLANLSLHCNANQLTVLYTFNNWIKNIASSADSNDDKRCNSYHLIDFFEHFTDDHICTQYEMFQMDARMVSGCSFPHVLWSLRGRKMAMNLLCTTYCQHRY